MASIRQLLDDLWSGGIFLLPRTHYNRRNILEWFQSLQAKVKEKLLICFLDNKKLLITFLGLPSHLHEVTTAEMSEILEIGSEDEHEGIRNLSEFLKCYPSTVRYCTVQYVNHDEVGPEFAEVTQEVKKTNGMSPEDEPMETDETQGAENADLIVQLPFGTLSVKFAETDATYNKIGATSEEGDFLINPISKRTIKMIFADASIDCIQNGGLYADVLEISGPTSNEMNVKVTNNHISQQSFSVIPVLVCSTEEAAIATYEPQVEPSPMEVDDEDQGIVIDPPYGPLKGGYPRNITMPKELSKEEKLVVLEFVGEGIVVAEKLSISDMFSVRAVPASRRRKPGVVQVNVRTVGGNLLGSTTFKYTLDIPTDLMEAISNLLDRKKDNYKD